MIDANIVSDRAKLDAGGPPGLGEQLGSIMFGQQPMPAIPQFGAQEPPQSERELLVPMLSAGSYRSQFRVELEKRIAQAFSPSVLELNKIQSMMQQAPMQAGNVFTRLLNGA